MVTIDDIASKASISRSSVAKILRGSPGFNDQTRQRVLQLASQMGYRPNYLSKALAGGRSMAMGLIAGGLRVPITMLKLSMIETSAAQAGYMAYTCTPTTDDIRQVKLAIQNLVDRRVDGMIIHTASALDPRVSSLVESLPIPVVGVNYPVNPAGANVIVNREPAMRDVVAHLAQLGHQRLAVLLTPSDRVDSTRKVDIYRKACEAHGLTLECDSRWMLDPKVGFKAHTYQLIRQRMTEADRPTALLLNNDDCAMAAMAALTDMGLRVPADVSVVGFDDLPSSQYLRPALTTIHQPREQVGLAAFEMLHKLMTAPASGSGSNGSVASSSMQPVVMDCELIIRQTTGPAPRHRD